MSRCRASSASTTPSAGCVRSYGWHVSEPLHPLRHGAVRRQGHHPPALPRLLTESEFAELDAGIVIQAYLKDSYVDLADLVALVFAAQQAHHRPAGEGA